jgi:hypothetical protein
MKSTKIITRLLLLIIMIISFTSLATGQSIEGDWYGKADVQGTTLRLNLHIKSAGEGYTCNWDSPDQNAMGMPATTISFKYPDFSFTYDEAGIKYTGKINQSYKEIKGTLFQAGQELEILFGREPIPAASESKAIPEGK